MKKYRARLLAESYATGLILAFVGGFLDAYTFLIRGEVFANAQTGNIVLFGLKIVDGEYLSSLKYFVPVFSFFFGVLLVEFMRDKLRDKNIQWRKVILIFEILVLLIVGFIPKGDYNTLANILVSFTCSMQVEAFRKINGNPYATTMCTGNLRSGTDNLYQYLSTKNKDKLRNALQYYGIILLFIIGGAVGAILTSIFGIHSVWFALVGLIIVLILLNELSIENKKSTEK